MGATVNQKTDEQVHAQANTTFECTQATNMKVMVLHYTYKGTYKLITGLDARRHATGLMVFFFLSPLLLLSFYILRNNLVLGPRNFLCDRKF